ncbi:MAG: TauD/TfdA family dioxygenase [Silicimonas sp.]|nr:TauD/TfdA family dioxygenase [Silicimonas sp.]
MAVKFRKIRNDEGRVPPKARLPLVIEPDGDDSAAGLIRWINENSDEVAERLLSHGGLLFRGFEIGDAEKFQSVALAIDPDLSKNHPLDDLTRNWRTKFVFEALDTKVRGSSMNLAIHHEDSYLATHPTKIMFYCHVAPAVGGETQIVDTRDVLRSLGEDFVARYAGLSLRSRKHFRKSMVEMNTGTDDRGKIEEICRENQVVEFTWDVDGGLDICSNVPTIVVHPETGELSWFNRLKHANPWGLMLEGFYAARHCHNAPLLRARAFVKAVQLGLRLLRRRYISGDRTFLTRGLTTEDGKPIPFADQHKIVRAYWRHTAVIRWQKNDVLVLDNRLVAHGRMPFKGHREILGCVTRPSGIEPFQPNRVA